VVVVTIVVPVGVLVVQRLVRVRVAVRFCQVQQHAGDHQPTAQQQHP